MPRSPPFLSPSRIGFAPSSLLRVSLAASQMPLIIPAELGQFVRLQRASDYVLLAVLCCVGKKDEKRDCSGA
jgi:hypothetical protein